jgi:predicted RNA-binding protein associated with RNAse of E/G family
MSRTKKKRPTVGYLDIRITPDKRDKLTEEDSYETRKKRGQEKKKKHKSVYQKVKAAEEAKANDNANKQPQGGRLAEKIRKMAQQQEAKRTSDGEEG